MWNSGNVKDDLVFECFVKYWTSRLEQLEKFDIICRKDTFLSPLVLFDHLLAAYV